MNPEDQEKARLQERFDNEDAAIRKALTDIFRKPKQHLNDEDKRFLQARRSYLTEAQKDEYSKELSEKLKRPDGKEEEAEVESLTRKELERMASDLGVENPEDRKLFPKNQDLIDAIEEKKEEKKKAEEGE